MGHATVTMNAEMFSPYNQNPLATDGCAQVTWSILETTCPEHKTAQQTAAALRR